MGAAVAVESLLGLSATGSASYIIYKYVLNEDPYTFADNHTNYDYYNPIARVVDIVAKEKNATASANQNSTNATNTTIPDQLPDSNPNTQNNNNDDN